MTATELKTFIQIDAYDQPEKLVAGCQIFADGARFDPEVLKQATFWETEPTLNDMIEYYVQKRPDYTTPVAEEPYAKPFFFRGNPNFCFNNYVVRDQDGIVLAAVGPGQDYARSRIGKPMFDEDVKSRVKIIEPKDSATL